MLQLNEQGLNVALYWRNRDPRSFINIVPTSAITGEGAPPLPLVPWVHCADQHGRPPFVGNVPIQRAIMGGGAFTAGAVNTWLGACCWLCPVPHTQSATARSTDRTSSPKQPPIHTHAPPRHLYLYLYLYLYLCVCMCAAGIPDLLQLVVKLTQSLMVERLMFVNNLEVRLRGVCGCWSVWNAPVGVGRVCALHQ